jgi:CO dehydrogenase maturation factor
VTLSLAVAGKGGVGKTSLVALVVRALRERGTRPILAVDADPNSNLAEALGVQPGRPLAEIREQGSSPEGSPSSGVGRARAMDDEIHRAITEAEGFDLVTMGRPEGPRCYCYVNNLLRRSLDSLSRNYAAVVLDNEAGMEHLSRRTTNNVDFLLAVTDPSLPALRAVQRILALSRDLPVSIAHRAVLVNRVNPPGVPGPIGCHLAELGVRSLPDVPHDPEVERAGATGRDVFGLPDQSPALVAARSVVEALYHTIDAQ